MPKFHLAPMPGRTLLSLEEKVKILADIMRHKVSAKEAVEAAYTKVNRPRPKFVSMTITAWRHSIDKALANDDPATISMCQKHGILEPGAAPIKNTPAKKAKKPVKS